MCGSLRDVRGGIDSYACVCVSVHSGVLHFYASMPAMAAAGGIVFSGFSVRLSVPFL